jgi:hypothetical protein
MPIRVRDGDDAFEDDEVLEEAEPVAGFLPDEESDLGPDERDADLMDGSWEQGYYAGRNQPRDWKNVYIGLALLLVIAMIVPGILVVSG